MDDVDGQLERGWDWERLTDRQTDRTRYGDVGDSARRQLAVAGQPRTTESGRRTSDGTVSVVNRQTRTTNERDDDVYCVVCTTHWYRAGSLAGTGSAAALLSGVGSAAGSGRLGLGSYALVFIQYLNS